MEQFIVEATYTEAEQWRIGFDLREVEDGLVKYGILHVQHKRGEEWKQYEASTNFESERKRPEKVFIASTEDIEDFEKVYDAAELQY